MGNVEDLYVEEISEICIADMLTAEEIVERNIYFTNPKAKILATHKVAASGFKVCTDLLASLDEDIAKLNKPWWKFW